MTTNMKFWALSTACLLALTSCTGKKAEDRSTEAAEKAKVKVQAVQIQPVAQRQDFTATVEANIKNNIAPQMSVRIDCILVEVGDRVKKGQRLVEMDLANVKQAKIQLDNLETEFRRIDELYKIGGTSKSSWDSQKTALEVSRTSYENLLENTRLESPVEGIITARNYDGGDMYSMGTPLLVVEQIRPVKLMVNVSESLFTQVKKGMEVEIRLDVYGDEVFKGKVSLVYPTIDPLTRTFAVEITIANQDERVRPGMFARVTMDFGAKDRIVAPDMAVIKQTGSGDRFIYVYKDGKVSYNKVELGRRMDDKYEVISGVEDGDLVVVTGQSRLTNGMEVEVVE